MKNTILIVVLSLLTGTLMLGQATVETKIWGIQVGLPPLSIFNETKLTNSVALRTEVNFGFFYSNAGKNWAISPSFHVEPRYYYNLQRRVDKEKNIQGNSGNFLSVVSGYEPGFALKTKGTRIDPNLYFIPSYGIRRKIGDSFAFEIAGGLGYGVAFKEKTDWFTKKKSKYKDDGLTASLRVAFEYRF